MSRTSPGIIRRPGVAAQEPAADALHAAQRLGAVADVDPHLGVLGHQLDRRLAVARVQQLEERVHRVNGTHGPSVAGATRSRRPSRLRRRPSRRR